jgi:Zn-dependent membrane protease YugP
MFFDPLYLIFMAPAFLISIIAQIWVKGAFSKYSKMSSQSGYSGAKTAFNILKTNGIDDVSIEETTGFLGDHYDPRTKSLRLSPDVYRSNSLAAIGVAAHEAGHALQHAQGYAPLHLRSLLVPVASIGSNLAWPLLFIGFFLQSMMMVKSGVLLFSGVVLFQLVTLPVEFNASRRALAALRTTGLVSEYEIDGSRKVLTAAAMTYVAAAAAAILQLLYFLLRAGLLGSRDD